MTARRIAIAGAIAAVIPACAAGPPAPVDIDTRHDTCAYCRMVISSRTTASQVVADGDEPRFFDDYRCLREGLAEEPPPAGAAIFVADHATAEWVAAADAVFTHVPGLQTPMGSGIVAHRDAASRERDPAAAGGQPVAAEAVIARRPR